MPVIHSAEKKVRKDKYRTRLNKSRIEKVKKLIKIAKTSSDKKNIQKAQSAIDKLVKVNIIHKNKAARLKSQLAKINSKETKTTAQTNNKKTKEKVRSKK